MEPAVSLRLCLKTHENNTSLNVCPVVEDEMDEDLMYDKEEPSEQSRPVKGGQSRVMMPTLKERQEHERTSLSKLVQTLCRCTSEQSCSPRSKVSNSD